MIHGTNNLLGYYNQIYSINIEPKCICHKDENQIKKIYLQDKEKYVEVCK